MLSSESSSSLLLQEKESSWKWKMGLAGLLIVSGILVVEIVNVLGTFELAEAVQSFKNSLIFSLQN